LPFNLSPQSGAYRPSRAPWVQAVVAAGYAAYRHDPIGEQEPFVRTGYDVRWLVPVAQDAALRMHHAGIWNRTKGARLDWHALWDLRFETELAGVTYYVGYQRGEAAPLFVPTESTRIGLSFATARPRGE